ncbi:MAG: hypothetical protein ACFB3T_11320 [Geminicoccaceae bacterium]
MSGAATEPNAVSGAKPEGGKSRRSRANGEAADNITTRNWDGWPTPPTPSYLIPEMGKIPVSSTAHFQTVAMTEMGEGVSADALWRKLRAPLLAALRNQSRNFEGRIKVTKAVFGDFTPASFENVLEQVRAMVSNNTLTVEASSEVFGDPAPGLPKQLSISYDLDGFPHAFFGAGAPEGARLSAPGELAILSARYGTHGQSIDVTATVQSMVQGNTLSLEVTNGTFGADPHPNMQKQLLIDYTIGGQAARHVIDEFKVLVLPLGLNITAADYGFFGGQTQDVTERIAGAVEERFLWVEASTSSLGVDPAPGRPKELRVDYTIDGVPGSVMVNENETISLEAPERRYPPDEVYANYFQPEPDDLATLAGRLVDDGVQPTVFDPDDEFASMEDVLERLMGIARDDLLDPFEHAHADAMTMPAKGVILYHEQGWYGRGLALGNVLHSVALAPGEVTQVAMTHWNHQTRATDVESVAQTDTASEASMQNRSVSEVQSSSMHEHAAGDSLGTSSSLSSAFGRSSIEAKANFLPFVGAKGSVSGTSSSVGSSHTISTAVTHSSGDRTLAMGSNQHINALTHRHAEAARTRRAAVVREVAQSEDETLTTRVVANYNHMHALTVMYFEIIEVFSLRTRVVDAERLIFLPYRVRDVRDLVLRYRAILVDAAYAAGQPELAAAIRHYRDGRSEIAELDARIGDVATDIEDAEGDRDEAQGHLDGLHAVYAPGLEEARNALKVLRDDRQAIVDAFSAYRELPAVFQNVMRQALHTQLKPIDDQAAALNGAIESLKRAEQRAHHQLFERRERAVRRIEQLKDEQRHLELAKRLLRNLAEAAHSGPFHDHRLYFNQAVWLRLSAGEVLGLAKRLDSFQGEKLYDSVDPTPVAVTGNYIGYRWRIRDPFERQRFKKEFVEPFIGDPERELATDKADVAVPTGGVFAEAVLGNAVSAEKIDLSRFWNWKDSMIPILPTDIKPLSAATPTPQDLSAEPGKLDESSAKFTPLQDLPAPSGFNALAQTMQAQVFRDMSGQSMLQSLAEATTQAAASSEQNAAQTASKNLQAGLDFMSDMASKALSVAAAPETGGASLLGGMVAGKSGGGPSLLGGVLNADGAAGGSLLDKMTGGKGHLVDTVGNSVLGGLANSNRQGGSGGDASEGTGSAPSGTPGDIGQAGDGTNQAGDDGSDLPPSELEPNPPRPGGP